MTKTETPGTGAHPSAVARENPDASPLELDRAAMERLAALVMQQLIRHRVEGPSGPASRVLSRPDADILFDEPLPLEGSDPEELVGRLASDVFSNVSHVDHPRFFAFVPGPNNFVATMAASLATGHNVFSGTWLGGSAAARLEQTVISWLRQAVGFPASGGGLFVSGGSMANLTAIGAARQARLGSHDATGVVYYSSQTHSAVERALRVLGFPEVCMRRLDADPATGLSVDRIRMAVEQDRSDGKTPFLVVANAGTTNTGAVDPLSAIGALCRREGLWFHVDGAYGAAAVFGRKAHGPLEGLQEADSIALDPHKWLFQPFECGCVLLREASHLRQAFAIHPEYMSDTRLEDEEINYCEYGVQLTRSFRALGVWMTFKTFGAAEVGRAIDQAFTLADHAASVLETMPGWEIVTAPSMAILTFRYADGPEGRLGDWNAAGIKALRESGLAMVSSTVIGDRFVVRLCTINPRTTHADIDATLEALDRLVREAKAAG